MTTRNSPSPSDRTALAGLGPLFPIVFSGFLALGLPIPVIALEVHDRLGFDAIVVGWAIGVQSLATVLTRSFAGRISDGRGPKLSTCLGLPLAAVGGSVYLLADLLSGTPKAALAALLLGRLLLGPAESLFLTGTMAWGIARLGPARTGRVIAWQGIAIFGALAVGAPLGLVIMARFGFAAVAATAMVVPLIGLSIAALVPAERAIEGRRVSFARVIGLVWRQGIGLMLAGMPFAALTAFVSLDYAARG